MAGRSSSRHKREIQGRDSQGDTTSDYGEEGVFGGAPTLAALPDISTAVGSLPANTSISTNADDNGGGAIVYTVVNSDPLFTIGPSNGTLTAGAGLTQTAHSVTVVVTNPMGSNFDSFIWTITA